MGIEAAESVKCCKPERTGSVRKGKRNQKKQLGKINWGAAYNVGIRVQNTLEFGSPLY